MAGREPTGKPASAKRRTQAERTALSDSRMYESAIELICELGTHNTTLKDVGERAGYSRGLASNRFGSKEALFANLIQNFDAKWAVELERHLGGRTGLDAIFAATESVEDFLVEQSKSMKAMYILWYEAIGSHSDVRARLAEHHHAYRRDICRWVEEGIAEGSIHSDVHPHRFAVQFCSFIFGTIYQWLVWPESIDVRQTFSDYRVMVRTLIMARNWVSSGPPKSTHSPASFDGEKTNAPSARRARNGRRSSSNGRAAATR